MKVSKPHRQLYRGSLLALAFLLLLPLFSFAQLPTPTYGWNLGNTLEAKPTEGSWGPAATQNLINGVANAGFNTVRIPCAWDLHANQSTLQIDPTWMARVKQVVDWCYARNLYVVLNIHWDGGWLENHITDTVDPTINTKMQSYWTQIANTFRNYDNHLVFAGANEPDCSTAAQWTTLRTYYDTFISAVRATGGNNASRWLVIQGPQTNYDLSDKLITSMPSDSTPGRLALEIHHYTPFPFCLMTADATWGKMSYFWGQAGYHSATRTDRNATFDEEPGVDSIFQRMVDRFASQGYPVIIGEYQAIKRTGNPDLTGADFDLHVASRTYFHKYVTDAANNKGLKPIYWDISGQAFDWNTGAVLDQDNVRTLTGGAALPPPGGGGIIANGIYRIVARHSGKALDVVGAGRTDGTNVDQWSYWGGENEKWVVTHLGNNQYSIVGAQSGKALDVSGWGTSNGTNVQIWTYGGAANQKWTITATSGGYYRLTPTHATSECLDVNAASSADGANVQIWQYLGGNNQQWSFQVP